MFAIASVADERRGVAVARHLNPDVHIVTRTRYVAEIEELERLGADEVVPEEFETSLEIFARVLRRYERWRRSDNALMQALTDGINQLFGVPGETPAAVRRTGLALVASGAPLRRRLAEHALGTVGDLPRRVARAI